MKPCVRTATCSHAPVPVVAPSMAPVARNACMHLIRMHLWPLALYCSTLLSRTAVIPTACAACPAQANQATQAVDYRPEWTVSPLSCHRLIKGYHSRPCRLIGRSVSTDRTSFRLHAISSVRAVEGSQHLCSVKRPGGELSDHRSAVPTRYFMSLPHTVPADRLWPPQKRSDWLQCADSHVRSVIAARPYASPE